MARTKAFLAGGTVVVGAFQSQIPEYAGKGLVASIDVVCGLPARAGLFRTGVVGGIDLASKALAAFDLMARDSGLVGREKARLSLAFHRVGQAEIGAVAGLSILRAGASRFAAFNEALRDGTPAQGDRFSQRKRDGWWWSQAGK